MRPVPGRGLANLVAELELRLTGSTPGESLDPDLAGELPDSDSYVLLLVDGLGVAQLGHAAAVALARAHRGVLQAPFPTTTSVALASVATAREPANHGLVSHLMWLEDQNLVANTLKWVDLTGKPVPYEYRSLLPRPNLWERLREAGVEPITVQPDPFRGSPLSRLLYRGARFEGAWDVENLIEAVVDLAQEPHRLIFAYVWQVDYAGHVSGLDSPEFSEAIKLADRVWSELAASLPPGAALVGTADHGLIQYDDVDKVMVRDERFDSLRFAGDGRGIQVWGKPALIEEYAAAAGASVARPEDLYGPQMTRTARSRVGERILLAPTGKVILPPGFDKRLRCYHGGLAPAEAEIPLLVG